MHGLLFLNIWFTKCIFIFVFRTSQTLSAHTKHTKTNLFSGVSMFRLVPLKGLDLLPFRIFIYTNGFFCF